MTIAGTLSSPQELLRENLQLKKSSIKSPARSTAKLQREIKRLNSIIIDLKVERDDWRDQATTALQRNSSQSKADAFYSNYLIVVYFEDILNKSNLQLPTEMTQYKQDLVEQLQQLGFVVGDNDGKAQ